MSELNVQAVQSQSLNAPVRFEDSAGTEIGTLCRAWVNFNGTGTVAIRASFNVSSITDNGVGDYTVNFTAAMPDADYAVDGSASVPTLGTPNTRSGVLSPVTFSTGSIRVQTAQNSDNGSNPAFIDCPAVSIAIFR